MTKLSTLNKYKGLLITIVQTLVICGMACFLTFLKCGFSFKEFDWITFIFSFVFTTTMKAIYTSYSKNVALESDDIVLLKNTINKDKREIFDARKTDAFKNELDRRNKMKKLEAYIGYLDSKNKPLKYKELREWAFNYQQALKNDTDITECEKFKSLKSVHISYEHVEYAKLFTYGANEKTHKNKYTFSPVMATFNRAVVPVTMSLLFSILFGTLQNQAYVESGAVWIDFFMYLWSCGMGAWWGLNNGKAIITEDYTEVLNNVASLIREIKSKIL